MLYSLAGIVDHFAHVGPVKSVHLVGGLVSSLVAAELAVVCVSDDIWSSVFGYEEMEFTCRVIAFSPHAVSTDS